jgi:uncharacterized lipoprotein
MYYLKIIVVLTLAALVGACSMFAKKEEPTLYQSNVKSIPPLAMPTNLTKEDQADDYPLPKLETPPINAKVSILPPGSSLATGKTNEKESKK